MDSKDISASNGMCSQPTGAYNQSSAELSTKPQHSFPLSSFFAPSFSYQQPSETEVDKKQSKWARFLPSVSAEEDENEVDGGERAQYSDVDHIPLAQNPVMPVATVPLKNLDCIRSGECDRGLVYTVSCVEKVSVLGKPSPCVEGNVSTRSTGTSGPVSSQKPVCVQPLYIKRPCAAYSLSTLFHTDEDFDDTY